MKNKITIFNVSLEKGAKIRTAIINENVIAKSMLMLLFLVLKTKTDTTKGRVPSKSNKFPIGSILPFVRSIMTIFWSIMTIQCVIVALFNNIVSRGTMK